VSYTLKFEHPEFPPDSEFSINELGLFLNGQEREISEDEERLFVGVHGITIEDALQGNAVVAVSVGDATLTTDDLNTLIPPEVNAEEEVVPPDAPVAPDAPTPPDAPTLITPPAPVPDPAPPTGTVS
jgi:hypothetical protein